LLLCHAPLSSSTSLLCLASPFVGRRRELHAPLPRPTPLVEVSPAPPQSSPICNLTSSPCLAWGHNRCLPNRHSVVAASPSALPSSLCPLPFCQQGGHPHGRGCLQAPLLTWCHLPTGSARGRACVVRSWWHMGQKRVQHKCSPATTQRACEAMADNDRAVAQLGLGAALAPLLTQCEHNDPNSILGMAARARSSDNVVAAFPL